MNFFQKTIQKPSVQYIVTALLAAASALIYEIFVFPNAFAPSGLNGLATMVQYLFGFNIGYMAIIINLPMLIVAWFVLNRRYALRTLTFVLSFSVSSILFGNLDFSAIAFYAEDGGGAILAAVAGGFFYGVFYSVALRMGGSTGGVDIIAAFINHKKPEYDTVWLIFILNALIAGISFFVYGMDYQAVILCIIYNLICSWVSDGLIKGARTAAKFEVVTTHPEALSRELMETLHHGCTVLNARGMYSNTERAMLICVVNRRQVVEFERIIRKYDDTFAYISTVNGTVGRFNYHETEKETSEETKDF